MRPSSSPLVIRSEEEELLGKIARCDTAMADLLAKRQRCEKRVKSLEERLAAEEGVQTLPQQGGNVARNTSVQS